MKSIHAAYQNRMLMAMEEDESLNDNEDMNKIIDRIETLRNYKPENLPCGAEPGTSGIRRPHFDVGEYLPVSKKGEIEFVRISLASTTGDVYSLRIKKAEKSFVVTIVDEYNTEFIDYKIEYEQITTQGEVFDIITDMNNEPDSQPYWLAIIEQNGFDSIEQITDFIQIDSIIYPDLNELFKDYLVRNNFNSKPIDPENELSKEQISAMAEIIKNNGSMCNWDSLMGTLCFNIWHITNYAFLHSNDINDMEIPFLCALNLFQKWDQVYLSKKYDIAVISLDASPFVLNQKDEFIQNMPKIKVFVKTIQEQKPYESSKHFITIFANYLWEYYQSAEKSINPLDYLQKGIEILFLFVKELKSIDVVFYNELMAVGEFESDVEEIIRNINTLEKDEL